MHIPYCKTRCPYCDFFTQTDPSHRPDFVGALSGELELRRDYLEGAVVSTVYFGGGTPSLLSPLQLEGLMDKIRRLFHLEEDPEVTLECNPDDVDRDYLMAVRSAGVNRLSLGLQSFDDRKLAFLGRRHDARQNRVVLEEALAVGLDNLSIDLIYGLPGSDTEVWKEDLERAFAFPIRHLSAYHLTIEPDTPFGRMKARGQLEEVDEQTSLGQFEVLIEYAAGRGMEHYELSNFCQPGYRSRHNSGYWQRRSYLGLGPSAHSYNLAARHRNISNLKQYMDGVTKGKPVMEEEVLDKSDHFNDQLITGLRTREGIGLDDIGRRFGDPYRDYLRRASRPFIDRGQLIFDGHHLRLSRKGMFISDAIMRELVYVRD